MFKMGKISPKPSKITKIPLEPKKWPKWPKYPLNLKSDQNTPKPKKWPKYPPPPGGSLKNDQSISK